MIDVSMHSIILPLAFPLIAGLLCLFVPRRAGQFAAYIALIAMAVMIVLCWPLLTAAPQIYDVNRWIHLKLDALNRFFIVATVFFGLIVTVYSLGFMKGKVRLGEYYGYLLWTVGFSLIALLANEFILLLIAWGFLGLLLYMLVGIGGFSAAGAAKKSMIIIGGSDAVFIFGIALFWQLTGTTRLDNAPIMLHGARATIAFFAIIIAAFAKAGAMPLHTWVPEAGKHGPASVAAFLPASLDKLLGIYLVTRATTGLFVLGGHFHTLIMFLGAATIICAVMMALIQHDMKRLLSYHAVSQVGYMILGIGTGTALGIAGGLFHMLNNALYKSALFLGAGAVESKTGTTDLDHLGGLAKTMPITFLVCLVASLSISGIPPLNGFASKWMIYQGIVEYGKNGSWTWIVWLIVAMLGSALTLASFVKVLHAVFLCKASPEVKRKNITEVGPGMWLPMAALAVICIITGIFATRLPLRYCIFPAVPGSDAFAGTWWAGPATIALVAAFIIGGVIYLISSVRKARTCPTYIGGEIMDTAVISDLPQGKERSVEVTGTAFYLTIRELPVIKSFYSLADKKMFDPYDLGAKIVFYGVGILRKAHNGVLPLYLTWFLAGALLVLGFVLTVPLK
ncbi:MAG: proton-conducting transporter membrane subunit [Chitinivibrionales bacterium]|nr:proton-conducting transporter membrane subunit [Chitinivibrionales bacterium]